MHAHLTQDEGMTVLLGGDLKNGHESCHALRSGGCHLNADEEEILELARFRADHGGKKFYLVVLSVAELDLDQGGALQEIYDHAFEKSYGLCPHDLVPYLRLQYSDQPKYQSRKIAMEPIVDKAGDFNIFDIGHGDEGMWLGAYPFQKETDYWRPEEKFYFVKSEEQIDTLCAA